jgi:glycosyltransferase involved in cell wall biosynthesis
VAKEPAPGGLPSATYSICMLCSNDGGTVKASVDSVLELSRYRKVEVIVVDNMSTDGSLEVLHHFRDIGSIKLIERRCSRGEGRQLAFEASSGDYVLSHMDCDDVFDASGIDSLIAKYHSDFEGKVLMTKRRDSPEASNITIAPRDVLERVGGWRSLNWGEDWDLWARLASVGAYRFFPYPADNPPHASIKVRTERYSGATHGFWVRVAKYADAVRSGRSVFSPREHVSNAQRAALAVAKARVLVRRNSLTPVPDPEFAEESVL